MNNLIKFTIFFIFVVAEVWCCAPAPVGIGRGIAVLTRVVPKVVGPVRPLIKSSIIRPIKPPIEPPVKPIITKVPSPPRLKPPQLQGEKIKFPSPKIELKPFPSKVKLTSVVEPERVKFSSPVHVGEIGKTLPLPETLLERPLKIPKVALGTKNGKQTQSKNKISVTSTTEATTKPQDCAISIRKKLILSSEYEFLYPEPPNKSTITIPSGETIVLSCSESAIYHENINLGTTITAICESDTQFRVSTNHIIFNSHQIICERYPIKSAVKNEAFCEGRNKEIKIGFQISEKFVPQITVCFNEREMSPLYVVHSLTKAVSNHEIGVLRPPFKKDPYFRKDFLNCYDRRQQKREINKLLGLPEDSIQYIKDNGNYYLTKGHLAPKVDFVYEAQQRATFYYVNAAPQWQNINQGDWKNVEQYVRHYATAERVDLVVYSGVYGVATLPHSMTGKEIELILSSNDSSVKIPVPELFWKIVYNEVEQRGIVLLGHNNPYKNVRKICRDICSNIRFRCGRFVYACTVDDFQASFYYLPNFYVYGTLRYF